jgi:predicted RNA binding protein YcfA (HicA-like mRNA interferase family)
MKAREVNRKIERAGGYIVRQTGSHRRYAVDYQPTKGVTATVTTIVAQHPGDIPTGTLHAIEKDLQPALGKGWLR